VPLEYPTIQEAIDAAQPDDTVIVSEGTYTGTGNKNLDYGGKAITVQSINPEDPCVVAATVIDCENNGRGFYFHSGERPDSILSGLTIKRGKVTGRPGVGGGIYCSGSSPTIEKCIITDNHVYGTNGSSSDKHGGDAHGGGIYLSSSSTAIIRCTFISNTSKGGKGYASGQDHSYSGDGGNGIGGGVYCEPNSAVTVRNCIFQSNHVYGGDGGDGAFIDLGGGEFIIVFAGNGGDGYGGGIYCNEDSSVQIFGCSILANEAVRGNSGEEPRGDDGISRGGGVYGNAGIENSILWDNIAISSLQIYGNPVVSYSDVEGGWSGEGNIDVDPCFIDPAGGDYHLRFDSPCINAGNPNYGPVPGETDIEGDSRIIDGRIDIGADEFNPEIPFLEISPSTFDFEAIENGPNPTPQILSVSNSEGGVLTWVVTEECNWLEAYPNNGQCTDEVNEVSLNIDISGLAAGFYNCELTISAEGALNSPQTATATLRIYGEDGVLKVPSEYGTIQAAIDVARQDDTVIVAEGTYTGAGNKNLDYGGKAITVRSIDPEDPCVVAATVIDCENSGRGFYFHSGEEANSVLAGFTIKRGRVGGRPAKGGAIYCSGASPTIKNCVITNNLAFGSGGNPHGGSAHGGGVYCTNSYSTLIDCTVSSNRAIGGQGDDLWCSPMSGCSGGMGSGGDAYGGGIYSSSDSPLTIVDCIISDNSASGGSGGVYYETGTPMEGASGGSAWGGGVYCDSVATVINNCSIVGNTATGGDGGQVSDPYGFSGDGGSVFGGGVCGQLEMSNCIIQGNEALRGNLGGIPPVMDSGGGGVCCLGSSSIENCLIVDNHIKNFYGSAVYHKHSGTFLIANCTIYGNTSEDPSVYAVTGTDITDSIIWGHGGRDVGGGSVTYSCTEQSISGTGNIHDEPRFVTGPLGNYYLSQTAAGQVVDSPCVDAGSDSAVNLGMDIFTTRTDELKDKSIVDMGYHYSFSPGSPDIDEDGDVDFVDYAWLSMGLFYETSKQIPSGSVVVDGDLSDWPGSVQWIELDKVYWGNPNDVSGARFALQWDAATDKIYAAVVVNDSSQVFLDEYVYWNASDRLEVYSQGDAEDGTGWNRIYDVAQQYYVAHDTSDGNWATWAEGETLGIDVGLEYAVDVNGAQIIYEVGVRQFDNYGGFSGGDTVLTDLHTGHVVGFDIVANTRWDIDEFGMLSENLMMYKYNDAGKFAKYILVDKIFSADLDGNGTNNYADLRVWAVSWLLGK
jgi:hypothetical protein